MLRFVVCAFLLWGSVGSLLHEYQVERDVYHIIQMRAKTVGRVVSVDPRPKDDCDSGNVLCSFIHVPYQWAYPSALHFRASYLMRVEFKDESGEVHALHIGTASAEMPAKTDVNVYYDASNPDDNPIPDPGIETVSWHVHLWLKSVLFFSISSVLLFLAFRSVNRKRVVKNA